MARTERHSVMYYCDQCLRREVAYDQGYCPLKIASYVPTDWYAVCRGAGKTWHLCSAKCLQAWAGKQGDVDGSG